MASDPRCAALCGAGVRAPWWDHQLPCPVRQAHEAAKREAEAAMTDA